MGPAVDAGNIRKGLPLPSREGESAPLDHKNASKLPGTAKTAFAFSRTE
jgi:hypothetical protein